MKDEMNRIIQNYFESEDCDCGYEERNAAVLLLNGVVYIDCVFLEDGEIITVMYVSCNDLFGRYIDNEEVHANDMIGIYDLWKEDPVWGPAVWCAKKRGVMPQAAIVKQMEENGWDLSKYVKVMDKN